MSNRIELDNDYALEFDGRCITLIHKVVMDGTGRGAHRIKAENLGKSRDVECGHFGRVDHALTRYVHLAAASASPDVKAVLAKLEELTETLKRFDVKCQPLEAAVLVEG